MDYVISQRSMLERNGFSMSKTFGKSMRPLIWGGQHCVTVVPLRKEPAPGDLLMFRQRFPDGKSINVVHRVVETRRTGEESLYITRGDNCLGCERVDPSEVIGRVAEVHRISGFRPWHIIPFRKFAVNDTAYLRYTRFWLAIWPARRIYYILRGYKNALLSRIRLMLKIR